MSKLRFGQSAIYSLGYFRIPFCSTKFFCESCKYDATHLLAIVLDGSVETIQVRVRCADRADTRVDGTTQKHVDGLVRYLQEKSARTPVSS